MQETDSIIDIYTQLHPSLLSENYTPEELQDERFLAIHISDLWETRQCYENAIRGEKTGLRAVDHSLGQMLYRLKPILARPGRNGGWSSWLKKRGIPRASADRLVQRFAAHLPKQGESPQEAITEPTQQVIERLLTALWPRIEKTLTTSADPATAPRCGQSTKYLPTLCGYPSTDARHAYPYATWAARVRSFSTAGPLTSGRLVAFEAPPATLSPSVNRPSKCLSRFRIRL